MVWRCNKDKAMIENLTHEFILKRKPNWGIVALTGAWIFGFLAIFGTVVYGFITDKFQTDLFFVLLLFFSVFLFCVKTFLWHLRGRERVILNEKELRIEREGTILSTTRRFNRDQIDGFAVSHENSIPKILVIYGIRGGFIEFEYLGQKKYFGQSLTKNEAKQIVINLNEKIRTTNR